MTRIFLISSTTINFESTHHQWFIINGSSSILFFAAGTNATTSADELIVTISPRHLQCAKHWDVRARHARRARRIWLIRHAARHGRHSEW
jgi:hypothetical protein